MFNPNQFARSSLTAQQTLQLGRPGSRIILQRMADISKTRWDEPLSVPDVLYQKFKLPLPSTRSSKQHKQYPLSLIDYIKRAYGKCKDEIQARGMEVELRRVIAQYQNLDNVHWEQMPLPNLQEQRRPVSTVTALREPALKKQAVPKEYIQHLGTKEEAPPQTKLKISMTLQKLEEKLSKKEEGKLEPQRKTFIGFQSEPDVKYVPQIRSEISPHLRTIFSASSTAPPPPPPPPPPKKEAKEPVKKEIIDEFSKKKVKVEQKSDKLLNVVESIVPQPINKKSTPIPTPKQPNAKQVGKVVITRKQLTQISKVATKQQIFNVAKRYESFHKLKKEPIKPIDDEDDDEDDYNEIIVGRSTCIDKPYLRITGRPDADTVRPEPILRKALAHFLHQHKKGTPYDILISQFKSIRQDITVQHIRNSFTVQVYEQNFKMSLFQNDIIQVKHCQANLWQLYRQGLYRTTQIRDRFISYNFITLILEEKFLDLQYMLTLLPQGSIEQPCIRQSLKLKKILLLGNYKAFFDFFNSRDEISKKLLNIYIDKIRMKCLVVFSKTCGEKITFSLLAQTVGEDEDVIEALAVGEGGVIRQGFFMLKESYQKLSKSDFLVIKKVTNLLI